MEVRLSGALEAVSAQWCSALDYRVRASEGEIYLLTVQTAVYDVVGTDAM